MVKIIPVVFLLFTFLVYGQDFNKCSEDLNILALELIKLELSGRSNNLYRPNCLKQDNFQYVLATHQPHDDVDPESQEVIVKNIKDVEINKIVAEDEWGLNFAVHFTVKGMLRDDKNKVEESFRDVLVFTKPKSTKIQKRAGCAYIYSEPLNQYLLNSCQ